MWFDLLCKLTNKNWFTKLIPRGTLLKCPNFRHPVRAIEFFMKFNFKRSWVRYDLETIPQRSKFNMDFVRNETSNMFSSPPILSIHQILHQPKFLRKKTVWQSHWSHLRYLSGSEAWKSVGPRTFSFLDRPFNSGTWYFIIYFYLSMAPCSVEQVENGGLGEKMAPWLHYLHYHVTCTLS